MCQGRALCYFIFSLLFSIWAFAMVGLYVFYVYLGHCADIMPAFKYTRIEIVFCTMNTTIQKFAINDFRLFETARFYFVHTICHSWNYLRLAQGVTLPLTNGS